MGAERRKNCCLGKSQTARLGTATKPQVATPLPFPRNLTPESKPSCGATFCLLIYLLGTCGTHSLRGSWAGGEGPRSRGDAAPAPDLGQGSGLCMPRPQGYWGPRECRTPALSPLSAIHTPSQKAKRDQPDRNKHSKATS